jgi:predicted GNAT family acetyltransferase
MVETTLAIKHNPAAQRFEAIVDGMLCRSDYRMHGDTMMLVHTEVPVQLERRGIGSALVQAAFTHAAEAGLDVLPVCSFVRAWAQRHPEVEPQLAGGGR